MEQRARVLVVEDDENIVDLIAMHLTESGFDVERALDGRVGHERATSGRFDLIILDLMLPELDGLSICRRLREHGDHTPILMLTARSEEMDKVLGLELGADDYLTKPFGVRELTARVKALMRRVHELDREEPPGQQGLISIGELRVDTQRHRVFLGDREVDLTAKEFDLLTLLAENAGQAFSRAQLLDRVWRYQHEGYNHTVNSHINRLRGKIEADPSHPRYVLTVWGYGYRFAETKELE